VLAAGHVSDVSLALTDHDVTVAEVCAALGLPAGNVAVDGHLIATPTSTRAVEVLAAGVQLQLIDPRYSQRQNRPPSSATASSGAADTRVEVSVVAGLDAGATAQLAPGFYRVDGSLTDPAQWYLRIDDPVAEAGLEQPWHDHGLTVEAVASGGRVISLSRPVAVERGYGGSVHRPPRALPAHDVEALAVQAAPPQVRPPSPLSWATLLAPIPIALIMAFFFRPLFALFAAMGPVIALFRWFESRRRFRRETKERATAVSAIQSAIAAGVLVQSEAEAQRRWLTHPHVGELWKRARCTSVRLWERRPESPGFMIATVGVGPDQFLARCDADKLDPEVHHALVAPLMLRAVPHTVDLNHNRGLGVHGTRPETLAIVRSLVLQLATLHGPADLTVGVVCDEAAKGEWDWLKWLPHANPDLVALSAKPVAKQLLADASPPARNRSASFVNPPAVEQVKLVIVDDTSADVAAICRAAQTGGHHIRILALAPHATLLPAACSSLLAVQGPLAEIATPELTGQRVQVFPVGVSARTAVSWARSLSAYTDPEVTDFAVAPDTQVSLLQLVGFTTEAGLAERWACRSADADPVTALGLGDDGPFRINLTTDGPHGLVAGTTGSGKSELLRTLVLGLAAECPPEHLNFVLIDFKGGGAFDAIAGLPHVAGTITDLDESMVSRAISSLRSELQRRETLFRELGVSDYASAVRRSLVPVPRLLIVIDEFAALATDHGDLMASIIDLAARGRSLGMHLILATQRPSGVVDQKIRANTNLRVALRVQDSLDSQDVIGVSDAARIDRSAPGRAIFSIGGDTPVHVQTAFSGAADVRRRRCSVQQHSLFADRVPDDSSADHPPVGDAAAGGASAIQTSSELAVLTQAIASVSAVRSYRAAPLWSAPLPLLLDWIDLGSREITADGSLDDNAQATVALGLVDLPLRQTQEPWRWNLDSGSLAIYGASAACAGKALVSVGAALASSHRPDELHLYVIDGDAGQVEPLAGLAHVGAVIGLSEVDRVERVVRMFESALAARRLQRGAAARPRLVLLIDNLASVFAMFDDLDAAALADRLAALARDGAPQQVHMAVTARTARDIGHRFGQQIPNRLTLALADSGGYLALGLRAKDVAALPAMRAIDLTTANIVQLVEPPLVSTLLSGDESVSGMLPAPVMSFPNSVQVQDLSPATALEGSLIIPIGVEAGDLDPAQILLATGEHALVVGTSGMGRSSTLIAIAHQLHRSELPIDVYRVGPRNSPLVAPNVPGSLLESVAAITALVAINSAAVVLVDDAGELDPLTADALEQILQAKTDIRVIAATTAEFARGIRSWTNKIRSSGRGVLLGASTIDADVFKIRAKHFDGLGLVPGRGFLIARGRALPAQFARP